MNFNLYFIFVNLLLFSFCLCELSVGQKEKLLNGYINYYNNLPNRVYTCQEGFLQNTQQVSDTTYQIVVDLKVTEISNVDVIKSLQCTATVQDLETGVSVTSNVCQDPAEWSSSENSQAQSPQGQVEVTEPTIERKPVQLDNEVQDTAITSGEQFIAVPRDQPSAPCIGCASHVNPQAAGVTDLANLGVKHLDIHEPSIKHSLDTVLDVERQVQVVNGVRYILTLSINFNECSEQESLDCTSSRICKVTILVKPWVKLPSGANYRAILANNCTEEWQYSDNGEVIPELPTTADHGDTNGSDDDIQVKHSTNVEAQPNREKTLTDEHIKNIQEQIIPNSQFQEVTEPDQASITSPDTSGVSKQHVFKVESGKHSTNSIPGSVTTNTEQPPININMDKKKAIDDLLSYFDFSGFQPKTEGDEAIPRVRRSYDYDLQVLSLAEDYHGIKKSIENARFMYEMAQAMVDYLNEMDMEIKNRAVKDVVRAEEEFDNLQRFVYVQARVIIPCDKVECDSKDEVLQICNGVIDGTNENSPQILNTFCYNDYKERDYRDVIKEISLDDPVLQRMAKEAMKKIETESTSKYAMKLNKIVSANIQATSGTLTKFSMIIDYIKCNKSVPLLLRVNCTVLEHLGSKICEIIIHERHWLKEKKISYTCTDRPVDMRISKSKSIKKNITVDDPKVIEMLQEAVQYLETQSEKNNKQKIVNIKSISSQIVAGFLIKIEFVVGYTNCTEENYSKDEISKCELMINEGLRLCKAQIWDRSWIIDGRQVEVSCDDIAKINEIEKMRKKRSIDSRDGHVQQGVNDSNIEYVTLANESLKKFLQSTSSVQHYKVVKIYKATVQEVTGKLIRIEFSISPTNCQFKSDGLLSSSKCYIVNSNNLFRCRSKILENLWLEKKQYFVNCNTKEQEQQTKTRSNELKEHNPSELKYHQLAEESMKKYLQDTGNSLYHRIVRVQRVSTQIVSGLLTSIDFLISTNNETDTEHNTVKCRSKVLEKHWLGTKDINVTCQMQENRKIPDLIDPKPDDPKYMQIAVESLQKFIKSKPESHLARVTFVDKVIQAGEVTNIRFLASHSEGDDGDTLCHAEYTEQGLVGGDIGIKCHLIGTVLRKTEINEDDPKYYNYVHLADESLHNYLQSINSSKLYTIINIENIIVQWEDGIKTLINFIASPIDFDNNEMQGKRCLSQILEQPWIQNKHISIKCEEDKELYRTKRQSPGGQTGEDPTNPEYQKLASESLQQYLRESGIAQPLEVALVKNVTTQVVAGKLTEIDFVVFNKEDSTTINCHSEIWDRPWLDKKEINVSCQNNNHRGKRNIGMPGGTTDEDPTNPEYQKLATESLQQYLRESGTTQPLKLERVKNVTTQVVAGKLIKIDFVVSNKEDSTTINCHSKIWDRPWLNKKEINVSCQNNNHRDKRNIGMPGGITNQDPTDPEYQKLATESLQQYLRESGTTQPLKLERVKNVTTQVVAGKLIKIDFVVSNKEDSTTINCHSKIWDRPWLNKKEINVSCQNNNHRDKRNIGMPGGITNQDPTDPEYEKLATESLQQYLRESGITQSLKLERIKNVTTQVVAGKLIKIDFVVFNKEDSKTINCHSEIWDRPWLNKKEINVSCQNNNHRDKRNIGLTGGLTEQDPTNPEYKKLAEESLQKYLTNSGNLHSYSLINILNVYSQVVSGSKILIDFTMAPTDNASSVIYCHSNIWEQQWLNKREIDVNCDIKNETSRKKRELIQLNTNKTDQLQASNVRGRTTEEQDPNQPKYIQLAAESLRKYQQKSTIYHKVIEVKHVSTRVIAGKKYEIDFSAAPTECLVNVSSENAQHCKGIDDVILYCHSEIWDRPWLKHKKIDIQCYGPGENDFDDYGSDDSVDITLKSSDQKNTNEKKYKLLAEEASEKYLTTSKRKYVHKVTKIHSVSENIADGTITKIEYTISPTTCLRNETSSSNDTCKIKKPIIVFHCNATIWDRPWMHLDKDIKVTCKKDSNNTSKKHKRDLGVRNVRQIGDDDDEMDEDTVYYYADRAVQHVNDQSQSNNLHKLITIHAVKNSVQMDTVTIKMYIEIAETFCLRHHREINLHDCEEMDGLNHRLCFVRLWPSPDDELIVRHVSVVCDDDEDFQSVSGVNIPELLRMSIVDLERSPDAAYKLVHQGEPQIIPSLDSKIPFKLNFIIATTNCSKDVDLHDNPFQCYINTAIPSKSCHSFIWLKAETKFIRYINAKCTPVTRSRRSLSDPTNTALDNLEIQKLVSASLEKLEMSSLHRYKQRVLQINSHSTKITSGKVTTIDFDVGYTSCLKYEWVENITSCDFLEHLPRRRCVAQIWQRLWIKNGKNIDVNCVDDETPLESHIEFESAEMANELAREALKHIEAKYPHPNKQKVVRIFSLEKQVIAGIHYRLKLEVGLTDCVALSEQTECKLQKNLGLNKFCRVNVWVRPWTDHPPNFRVSCDFQEGTSHDFYHHVQAEHLFYNFLTTYNPSYVNDYSQMQKRFEIFKTNIKKIHEFNVHEKGTATYGVTRFTDLTYEEFSSTYMGLNKNLRDLNQIPMKKAEVPDIKIPQNFDWREYDAVTEVKDQGSCGSCWAFSVTGNIEGQWKMQSGQLVSLSEQELVDCDKMDQGCNGGLPDNAYRAIEQMGGLELESDYPYEAVDDKCEFNKTLAKVQISGAVNITTNETGMAQWLVHNGPISIGINANAMQFYMGGISHPWKMLCNPTNLDHGVLIVGYGIKDYPLFHKQLPYWIVKNSWGKSWGEQGYYRVFRGDGTCGVNQMASSAVI